MTCLLIVAKAPVAGLVKTRLGAVLGPRQAARVAAAALLDTVDAVLGVPGAVPVVALTGDLEDAERAAEVAEALARCTVIPQRGKDFAERLANAHGDAATIHPGRSVFQIGMDTPQVTPELLDAAIEALHRPGVDAVLGPAADGGWWALGLRTPTRARVLRRVPMSRPDTGASTLAALRGAGLRVDRLPELSDVDTVADALRVAEIVPRGRFAAAVAG
jgi:rSAM/selenodomain-associated transferase 1